jgi:hypothetical protein
MYAAHKRVVEKKSMFFPEKMPSCPARTVQPAHLPASSPSSASPGVPPPLGAAHAPSPDARCGLPGLHSLDADFASPSMAALVSNAVSRGTGSPSLPPVAQVSNLCVFPLRIRSTRFSTCVSFRFASVAQGFQPVCLSPVCLSDSHRAQGQPERRPARSPRPHGRSACRGERPTRACRAGGGSWRRAPTPGGSGIAFRMCR